MMLNQSYKNIRRNKKRTILTILGIIISVFLMTSAYSTIVGLERYTYSPLRLILGGDIFIFPKNIEYIEVKPQSYFFNEFEELVDEEYIQSKIKSIENIEYFYSAIFYEILTFYEDEFHQGILLGIDFEKVNTAINVSEYITEGRYFTLNEIDKISIIVNEEELRSSVYQVGDKFEVLFPKVDIRDEKIIYNFEEGERKTLRIIGALSVGIKSSLSYIPITTIRESTGIENKASYVAVTIKNFRKLDETTKELQKKFPEYTVLNLFDMLTVISKDFQDLNKYISQIIFIMYLVSALIVANTMLVSVEERKHEIAILKSIGAKNYEILFMFLIEAALLGFFGSLVGFLLGALFSKFAIGIFVFDLEIIMKTIGVVIFISIIAGIYPALKASKIVPMEVLRYA
ncbi:MAG: ABC transporter permease [Candidatus Methanofastidiosia archaeon]